MKKALDAVVKLETILASAILVILIACTFSGVFARYLFGSPFTWEEEVQLACMVWITFLAAPIAFHTKSHVAIEIVVDFLPQKLQRVVEVLILISVYAILIYFLFRSMDFISVLARTGRKTPILMLPYSTIYGIAPVSIVLMLVSYTYETVKNLLSPTAQDEKEGL